MVRGREGEPALVFVGEERGVLRAIPVERVARTFGVALVATASALAAFAFVWLTR